jgi:gluconate kinase
MASSQSPYPSQYETRPSSSPQSGKLIWISGGTGSGKTTVSELLRDKGDYVYYEGDCFMFHLNPYTDTVPNGAGGGTPLLPERLEGVPAERIAACKRALDNGFMKVVHGKQVPFGIWEDFYLELCADVKRERERLGPGWNFVVAQAVYTRQARDLIRDQLGPALSLVVLDVDKELQAERLAGRFGMPASAAPNMMKVCQGFEPAVEDEPRTFDIKVTRDKSATDVLGEVLDCCI